MSLTKAQVREAFRAAAALEFADVPAADAIDHTFSEDFCAHMDELIARQKSRLHRPLSHRARRILVVAAILLLSLLLLAATPVVQEKLGDLFLQITEGRVDYGTTGGFREKIETVYALTPVPEGFTPVEEMREDLFMKTQYEDAEGRILSFSQGAFTSMDGVVKHNENGEVLTEEVGERSVMIYLLDTMTGATWVEDGYVMDLNYLGVMPKEELLTLVASVAPVE